MSLTKPSALNPDDRLLRQFAGLWVLFFGVSAVVQEVRSERHLLAAVFGALAVTIGPLGLAWPRTIKPIFIGWMTLVYPIGWVVSRVMLAILFYAVFTPFAWAFKVAGRDELRIKPRKQLATYWQEKPPAAGKAQYLRPF